MTPGRPATNRGARRGRRCWPLAALLALAVAGAPPARADAGRVLYDAAVLRPLGLVRVVVGAALFPLFYLGSLATGGSDTVRKVCIEDPVEQTFLEPLGHF